VKKSDYQLAQVYLGGGNPHENWGSKGITDHFVWCLSSTTNLIRNLSIERDIFAVPRVG
jgi:hypothetical protein